MAWGALLYVPTLSVPFHYDDEVYILDNPAVHDPLDFGAIFKAIEHPARFVPFLTFAWNYAATGENPWSYHLVNIFIHLLNTWLVFRIAGTLLQRDKEPLPIEAFRWWAFIAAAVFLVHPLQTQAVTYITQRFASLATMFYLGAFLCFLESRERIWKRAWRFRAACLFLMVAGMATKETVLTLPVMIAVTAFLFPKTASKDPGDTEPRWSGVSFKILLAAALLIIPAIYHFRVGPMFRMTAESGSFPGDRVNAVNYFLTQFPVLLTYLRLLVFPVDLHLLYDFPVVRSPLTARFLIPACVFLALAWTGWRVRKSEPVISFGIAWFFITLSVESTLIPIRHVIFEHRMYLPMAGLVCAFVAAGERLGLRGRWGARAGLYLLLCVLTAMTWRRNEEWKDPVVFWTKEIRLAPRKAVAHYNRAYVWMTRERPDRAIADVENALRLRPDYPYALNLRGLLHLGQGRDDAATADLKKAVSINPGLHAAWNNLGRAALSGGKTEEAIRHYSRAIEMDPSEPVYYVNRSRAFSFAGRWQAAEDDLEKALSLRPDDPHFLLNKAGLYLRANRLREAERVYRRVVALSPRMPEARYNLGKTLGLQERWDEALESYTAAIQEDPDFAEAYLERAIAFARTEQWDRALEDISHAIRLNPLDPAAFRIRAEVYRRTGREERALREFQKARELSP